MWVSCIRIDVRLLQVFQNRVQNVVKRGLLVEREFRPRQDGEKFIACPIINSFTAR